MRKVYCTNPSGVFCPVLLADWVSTMEPAAPAVHEAVSGLCTPWSNAFTTYVMRLWRGALDAVLYPYDTYGAVL